MRQIPLLGLLLLSVQLLSAQQKCQCEAAFQWVKATFEKNDAGFAYGLQQKGKALYQKHNALILAKIRRAENQKECADIMREWLSFFRKGHCSIVPVYNDSLLDKTASSWSTLSLFEAQIKAQAAPDQSNFSGIWRTATDTIGIVKEAAGYQGVLLSSSHPAWKPGYVSLSIDKDSSGVFYWRNFSPDYFHHAKLLSKNILKLGAHYLVRCHPPLRDNTTDLLFAREMTTTLPFVEKLSDQSMLLRIPTFNGSQKSMIDSVLNANSELLKNTANLIIDIRGNGGGSDRSYQEIIPLFYTNPIRTVGVAMYSTELNNQRMQMLYNNSEKYGFSEAEKRWFKTSYDLLEKHLGEFVNLNGGKVVSIVRRDTVLPFPKKVAIIVDGVNGSTAEQFLLAARQSTKVKLFGVTTAGVLDISNMNFVISPDQQFRLGYSLSKSYRIPDMAIDGKGIAPDYYIDKSISDNHWLDFVQKILEQ